MKDLLRVLKRKDKITSPSKIMDSDVIMISTFGADKPLRDIVAKVPNKDTLSIKMVSRKGPTSSPNMRS